MNGLEKQPLSGSISLQRVVYLNTPNIWGSEGIGGPETAANHRKPVVVDLDIQKEVPAHHKLISIKSSAISLHDSVQTVSQFERLSCDPFEGSKIRFGLSPAAKGTACATVVKIVVSYSYAIESDE
jgi:hypothetical protein